MNVGESLLFGLWLENVLGVASRCAFFVSVEMRFGLSIKNILQCVVVVIVFQRFLVVIFQERKRDGPLVSHRN